VCRYGQLGRAAAYRAAQHPVRPIALKSKWWRLRAPATNLLNGSPELHGGTRLNKSSPRFEPTIIG